jgi:hypothetical protein
MMNYIIDMHTKDQNKTIAALRKLKTTLDVQDGGVYWQDDNYSQIWLESVLTEDQIEDWLYRRGFDYVGVIKDTRTETC